MQAAAVAVGRPWSTIRRWHHEGRFPTRGKQGGRLLVALEDIEAIARRGELAYTPTAV